jgi:hypothetical protein
LALHFTKSTIFGIDIIGQKIKGMIAIPQSGM